MSVKQSFLLALKGLATSKMRAFLTMLGIIIGVAAVIVIVSLGNGMTVYMNDQFSSMGSNLLQISVRGRGSSRSVSVDDMYALVDEYPEFLAAISPSVGVGATVKYGTETLDRTGVTGVGEDFVDIRLRELSQGRFIEYIDILRLQKVCVIGSYLDKEIFGGDSVGKSLRINGYEYTVVGVLTEKDTSAETDSNDNLVYIPYTNATRLIGNAVITSYVASAKSEDVTTQAKGIIEARLMETFGSDSYYSVTAMSEILSMMDSILGMVMMVLIVIAGISLLVGGIGIMNIMLVSVTERTREIGIRKSLGAKGKDIRGQFIIEAGTTSAIGGLLGIGIGIALASAAGPLIAAVSTDAAGFSAVPSLSGVLTSAGVSVVIGVLFGYLPANKAAKLNPIDALRYD